MLLATGALAACGASDNEPGPGGVTVGEARALDEAAAMIEAKRLPARQDEEASAAEENTEPDTADEPADTEGTDSASEPETEPDSE